MSKILLIVAEAKAGKLRQVTFETIGAARTIADEGDRLQAVVIGSGISGLTNELAAYGLDHIYVIDDASLEHYNPEAYYAAISEVLRTARPNAVLLGHTAMGKDLAPQIATALGAGQVSDVIAVSKEASGVSFTRPIYAGKAFEKRAFAGSSPWVVTFRPNNIAAPAADGAGTTATTALEAPAPSLRSVIKEVVKKTSGKIDLTEAKVVVSGGRGVKSADGFAPLEELANVLGGAVGASRGACDAGYCDYGLQIGQTGKVVTPEIYIACGISGAIQHLAGMSGSRVIIAINKDPEAPIFKVADYGIVGDLFEVVPLLTQEFKQLL
ncbi:electron transfer flavoprotein subunit alpha/FixB family protein [Paenibacillus albiflavus]|uniref:Electron transfer flavoprotein subunit alpha/FixB family protein n=1 Tax=Paenibacillus albiflavus TaxID=2545760 RepID=A0A4R4E2S6_9BACL|nr:electron transfer flavoprotein subunit alpha/FixB family protein [Paenibacillus albiflavus]TCZ73207.1 electron transfer flavoprotein subunit alpha/FixB family protein [Paenibacillus albiflavus]